ncbi:ankyrin repeat domain-containing protein, partial [bacterium]|nr:ankyrin repeat domain-containing protein [bacterium]
NKPKRKKQLFNMQNKQGYTPLMRAAQLRNYGLVKLLLDQGKSFINFSLKNKNQKNTLEIAQEDSADDSIIGMIKKAQEQ